MKARYLGTCVNCAKPITLNMEIEKAGRGYAHTDCSNPVVSTSTQKPREHTYKDPDADATPKQRELIVKLSLERVVPDDLEIPTDDALTVSQAGAVIDRLFEAPFAARKPVPGPEVIEAGRYAIEVELRGEKYDMILRVWRGSQNPRVVRVYNDDTGQEIADKADTLNRIVDYGVSAAAVRYGRLRKRCYRCNAKLKNRLSVELGMGENVCLEHRYGHELAKSLRADARAAIRARGEDPTETVHGLEEPEQLTLEEVA